MDMNKPVSKVLVLDDCPAHAEAIKRFCDENNLIGLKVRTHRLPAVLRQEIYYRVVTSAGRALEIL